MSVILTISSFFSKRWVRIFVVVISVCLLWKYWHQESLSVWLVLFGVVGEILLELPKDRKFWKIYFWGVLIFGLAIEIPDSIQNFKKAQELRFQIAMMQMSRSDKTHIVGFVEEIKGKSDDFSVIILYEKNDSEAQEFGMALMFALYQGGWKVSNPSPIPEDMICSRLKPASKEQLEKFTSLQRATGTSGSIIIVSKTFEESPLSKTPPWALSRGLNKAGLPVGMSTEPAMPPNQIVLFIGRKP